MPIFVIRTSMFFLSPSGLFLFVIVLSGDGWTSYWIGFMLPLSWLIYFCLHHCMVSFIP